MSAPMNDAGLTPRFSMVLCTRNPREKYLTRVLAALDGLAGNAPRELVVVDSSSTPPLRDRSIAWPEGTTILRLEESGVARARAAGVRAAYGEWVVFVDDDNVLDPDYLQRAEEIIRQNPAIVLFCGRISGEFEEAPPAWLAPFYRQLAIIDFDDDTSAAEWIPSQLPCWTAGMCVRRDVVTEYCDEIAGDPFALSIQTRVEDVYLVMRTVAKGYTAGLFRRLHLRHLIPPERMTIEYLCKIVDETAFNMTVLRCRESGVSVRDVLRPLRSVVASTLRHGWNPAGRISRTAAYADVRGAISTLMSGFSRTCPMFSRSWP